MKHPNKKVESTSKWFCKFLQSIKKSRKRMVEQYVNKLEENRK